MAEWQNLFAKRLGALCRERVKVYARRSEQRAEIMRDGLSETADFKGISTIST